MESRGRSGSMVSGVIRRARLVSDLREIDRSLGSLVVLLENARRSLSHAPITSRDWMLRLLLSQMDSGLTTLEGCMIAALELEQGEADPLKER